MLVAIVHVACSSFACSASNCCIRCSSMIYFCTELFPRVRCAFTPAQCSTLTPGRSCVFFFGLARHEPCVRCDGGIYHRHGQERPARQHRRRGPAGQGRAAQGQARRAHGTLASALSFPLSFTAAAVSLQCDHLAPSSVLMHPYEIDWSSPNRSHCTHSLTTVLLSLSVRAQLAGDVPVDVWCVRGGHQGNVQADPRQRWTGVHGRRQHECSGPRWCCVAPPALADVS